MDITVVVKVEGAESMIEMLYTLNETARMAFNVEKRGATIECSYNPLTKSWDGVLTSGFFSGKEVQSV